MSVNLWTITGKFSLPLQEGSSIGDRETKKSLFYAHVPNAHSAEYLPKDRIAVALSTHSAGNSLELYELNKPEKVIFRDSLFPDMVSFG